MGEKVDFGVRETARSDRGVQGFLERRCGRHKRGRDLRGVVGRSVVDGVHLSASAPDRSDKILRFLKSVAGIISTNGQTPDR